MKKITVFLILLVVFSTIFFAGCTQQKSGATTTPKPGVTAVQTIVSQIKQEVKGEINQTVSNVTNKTEQIVSNLTNKTEQKIANLTKY